MCLSYHNFSTLASKCCKILTDYLQNDLFPPFFQLPLLFVAPLCYTESISIWLIRKSKYYPGGKIRPYSREVKYMKVSFIGMGNMGYAIARGLLESGALKGEELFAYDPNPAKVDLLVQDFQAGKLDRLSEVADSDLIFVAVKPYVVEQALRELGDALAEKAVVCIALGWRFEELSAVLPASTRHLSVMPNTPMQVGEGMCIFEERNTLTASEHATVRQLFASFGEVEILPTRLMSSAGTVTGCGPAFVYMVIEALADAAVYHGVTRADAYRLVAQTVLGAGKMVLETGLHPGQLKDNVCSPGGTTIRGVAKLEELGLRSALIEAIREIEGTNRPDR
jgi:pyrroline-5-carboxylate reductase